MTGRARDLSALGPPPRPAEQVEVVAPPPAPAFPVVADPDPAPGAPASREQRKTPRKTAAAPGLTGTRAVAVHLPGPLAAQLKAAVTEADCTYAEWVLDVFDRHHERLPDLFEGAAARRAASGLPPRHRTARRRVESPTQVQLRLTPAELAVLDRCRAGLGGVSRSDFVSRLIGAGLNR